MPPPLIIAGAGGFARETVSLVGAINSVAPRWELVGIVDDDPGLEGSLVAGLPVLGPLDILNERTDVRVAVCIGNPSSPRVRERVVERLRLDPQRCATLVHPAAVVPDSARIGAGSVVHATSVMTADVVVGEHVAVMPGVVLTHDVVIEDFCTFGSGALVSGGVQIGSAAYIGAGCVIREGLRIGSGSVVGAGAVVTRSVPDDEVWVGNPARLLRSA